MVGLRTFRELLTHHRIRAGLTQEQLAERSGLSVNAVSLLERGARTAPRSTTVRALADALALGPAERESFAAAARRKPDAARPSLRLHTPPTPFIGRARELSRAQVLLARAEVRLLTLTGPPGSGKTRLAIEVARRLEDHHDDGAVFVALGSIGDPALVMLAVRDALGLREAGSEPALETVVRHCRDRHLLLALDNFEHVLPATAELTGLLARCPDVRALVTSRVGLRLRAEHVLAVPPLEVPGAALDRDALLEVASVRLLVERAEAATPSFQLTAENAGCVAGICRRLDGLPLALELAAPWLKLLTPAELLGRLDRRLDLLVDGPHDLPERQRTLRATLNWSCDLMDEESTALLRRLSVFAGGAPLDALASVCGVTRARPDSELRPLAVLVNHNLVHRQPDAAGEARVRMLESVREYARDRLAAAGELEATADAHLDHYARLAAEAREGMRNAGQTAWLRRLRREHDNVRAALAWAVERGRAEAGLRLAGALRLFWYHGGHRHEGLTWLQRLLAIDGAVAPDVRGDALRVAGALAALRGSYDVAMARHLEAMAIFRELGDHVRIADGLMGMAETFDQQGHKAEAVRLLEEANALLRRCDDPWLLATAMLNLGVYLSRDDPARATALYEEALAIRRRLGDTLGCASCLINLGARAEAAGDLDLARARLDEAVATADRCDSPAYLAMALVNLGQVDRAAGDLANAGSHFRSGLAVFVTHGDARGVTIALVRLAWLDWREGRAERASRLYGAAHALHPGVVAGDNESDMHREACEALRAQLGDGAFAAAFESGRYLSAEAAAAEASAPA
ncbi:MAG TPA: tetratricopeptide repeat protein [Candidatus Dormibacteraeota bacterium]